MIQCASRWLKAEERRLRRPTRRSRGRRRDAGLRRLDLAVVRERDSALDERRVARSSVVAATPDGGREQTRDGDDGALSGQTTRLKTAMIGG